MYVTVINSGQKRRKREMDRENECGRCEQVVIRGDSRQVEVAVGSGCGSQRGRLIGGGSTI